MKEEPKIKEFTLPEKISEILNFKWNQDWCPFCDFKGKPKQVIHHIISMHREKYNEYLTPEAKIMKLIGEETLKSFDDGVKEGKQSL